MEVTMNMNPLCVASRAAISLLAATMGVMAVACSAEVNPRTGEISSDPTTDGASSDATTDGMSSAPDGDADGASRSGLGVPAIDPVDPHRFVIDGKPWMPAGYYPGASFAMTTGDYKCDFLAYAKDYVDVASSFGINYFRIWINWGTIDSRNYNRNASDAHILHPYQRTGPGKAVDGKPKVDLDKFNDAYFDHIAQSVDYAAAHGMVVQLMLLDCGHIYYSAELVARDYFKAANNVNGIDWSNKTEWIDLKGDIFPYLKAFVERVVATVGDRPGIIWETCNEKLGRPFATYTQVATDPFHVAMGKVVRAKESDLGYPAHLIMPLDLPEHRTVAGHRTPAPKDEESIAHMHGRLAGEQHGWNVPLISDNDCCGGEPDADLMREKAWAALTAGAYVDVFNNELPSRSVLHNANTADGMKYVSLTRAFVEGQQVDLRDLDPADELVTGNAWAAARAGDEYVVYLPRGGSTTVSDLASTAVGTWFDPHDGATSAAGSGPKFTAPDGRDWVLHVRVP
jgi:hypothetical protein